MALVGQPPDEAGVFPVDHLLAPVVTADTGSLAAVTPGPWPGGACPQVLLPSFTLYPSPMWKGDQAKIAVSGVVLGPGEVELSAGHPRLLQAPASATEGPPIEVNIALEGRVAPHKTERPLAILPLHAARTGPWPSDDVVRVHHAVGSRVNPALLGRLAVGELEAVGVQGTEVLAPDRRGSDGVRPDPVGGGVGQPLGVAGDLQPLLLLQLLLGGGVTDGSGGLLLAAVMSSAVPA